MSPGVARADSEAIMSSSDATAGVGAGLRRTGQMANIIHVFAVSARSLFHCLTSFSAYSMSLMFCTVRFPHTDSHSDAIQGVRDSTGVEDEDAPAKGWQ